MIRIESRLFLVADAKIIMEIPLTYYQRLFTIIDFLIILPCLWPCTPGMMLLNLKEKVINVASAERVKFIYANGNLGEAW